MKKRSRSISKLSVAPAFPTERMEIKPVVLDIPKNMSSVPKQTTDTSVDQTIINKK